MAKKKQKLLEVPKNVEELNKFVFELGAEARAIELMNIRLESKKARLAKKAAEMAAPRHKRAIELLEGIFAYAETNRSVLTQEGKRKTVELPNGSMQWRWTPPSVALEEGVTEEKVIASLKKLGLEGFIRTKEELNKEAILADEEKRAEGVAGILVNRHEDFIVKPNVVTSEIVRGKGKKRKL